MYREDADVAWRAQLMGWRCIYTPLARGYHVRNVLPGNRRALPPEINMHSVKNRFLHAHQEHDAGLVQAATGSRSPPATWSLWAHVLLREHSSLRAFWYLARNWRRVVAKRGEIMRRRRAKDDYIASWFSYKPVSRPAPKPTARTLAKARAARG